jgi:3-hydroxyisobutyrate dehydrogenase-like beta-hydroxyacid dehydrogenase
VDIGLVSPGAMGAAVGRTLLERGHRVVVALDDRSRASLERATAAGLTNTGSLPSLVEETELVLSIVPPDRALAVAEAVVAAGRVERYVDANAISPARAAEVHAVVGDGFVDGDLIGGPPRPGGGTRLYLSGRDAEALAPELSGDGLQAVVLTSGPYAASAMKMAYAAWSKGTAALLLGIRAYAEAEGVDQALLEEWARTQPELADRAELARAIAPKGWRFAGEMEEIAAAFAAHDLPDGYGLAAAEIYRRLAGFKDADPAPDWPAVAASLGQSDPGRRSPSASGSPDQPGG